MKNRFFSILLALLLIAALLLPVAGVAEELSIDAEGFEEVEVVEANDLLEADESSSEEGDLLSSELEGWQIENGNQVAEPGTAFNAGEVSINSKNFPDKEFRKIVQGFDENEDGKLSSAEIEEVTATSLWISKDCANFKGIEYFYNLELLEIMGDKKLKSLDVSKNVKLKELICTYVGLSELNISGNTRLAQLIVSGNKLTSIDIGNCPKLVSTVKDYEYDEYNGITSWETKEYVFALEIDSKTRLMAGNTVLYDNSPAVKLSKDSVKLGVKEKYTLAAEVTPSSEAKNLRFKTSNKKIATVDSKTGKITAKKKGTATISATLNGKVMAKCKVTVKKAPGKVSLNKTKVTVNLGDTYQLKATVPSGTYTSKYTWKSSNEKVATVDKNGLVTGVKKGTAKITVKTANGKSKTCKVTVTGKATSVSLDLYSYLNKSLEASANVLGWTQKQKGSNYVGYQKNDVRIFSLSAYGPPAYTKAIVNAAEITGSSIYNICGITWGMSSNTAINTLKGSGWGLEGELPLGAITVRDYTKGKYELEMWDNGSRVISVGVYYK